MIRAVSWNIELGRNIDGAAKALAESRELCEADIVLAQEMSAEGTAELADLLGMHYAYDSAAPHAKTGESFGNAILSRSPLRDVARVRLPHAARIEGQPRTAVFANTAIDGCDVLLGSIHLETVLLALRRRREQIQPAADFLARSSGPTLIGGDFNTASSRSLEAFSAVLGAAGLGRPEQTAHTFRRFGRPFVLDHFFVRECGVESAGVCSVPAVSDHDPIWINFDVE